MSRNLLNSSRYKYSRNFIFKTIRLNSQLVRNTLIDASFGLNEQQRQLQQTALEFAKRELKPFMRKWDEEELFPAETLRKAASIGYAALYTPKECGGAGLSRFDSSLVVESLAQGCMSTAAFLCSHNIISSLIATFANDNQKSKYMSDLCSMKKFGSYCLTEPDAGSDATSLTTVAKKEGDYYILNGTKCFITGGGESEVLVVFVRTGEKGPKGITALIVDGHSEGIAYGENETFIGWRCHPTRTAKFENCKVPISNILVKEGYGFNIAMKTINGARTNIASCSLGGAQRAMEETIEHVTNRKQFNKRIADFQNTQFRLAEMASELVACRLLVRHAASTLDASEAGNDKAPVISIVAAAKMHVTERCFHIANDCMQLFGAYGCRYDCSLQQLLRDLRVHRIVAGTNEMMRLSISRDILPRK
ncbi:isobutyryl-CoA dehydrogenase-like isoform X2 [Leptotrombidium deliense]|uniref:Isobutyryl-CoA dehydrogenase-like isoform X2 n=1 Tax=Leptotrombidium deliense TaxID=299467 RepID=A0A443RZJ9_9ACAR|nr:isobutyryl-CoA dehydrogenase-like isoform X2 [Leptotrombidium deliense]